MDDLLTIQQVAEYLSVSPKTVRRRVARRGLPPSVLTVRYLSTAVTCSGGYTPGGRAEVAKLTKNIIKRKNCGGNYFRKRFAGRVVWVSLGTDLS